MKNQTNISNITAEKFLGVLTELRKRMSGEDPVIPWENFLKFVYLSRKEQEQLFLRQSPLADLESQLTSWAKFYATHFGIDLDVQSHIIPEKKAGFDRLIVIPKGITIDQVWKKLTELFPTWKVVDGPLSKAITHNDREPTQTYAIWVRDRVEADEENKSKSANDLDSHIGMTLLERLLFEAKYFEETGDHLDKEYYTLCTGSRLADGGVPCVDWGAGRLRVSWGPPSSATSRLRSRSVVS